METNKLIDNYLNLIDSGLAGKKDPWKLAIQLEDFVDEDLYKQLEKSNPKLLSLLADDIFDITEQMEPGKNSKNFFSELTLFKQKVLESIK